jgi:tRNA-guanine family transglycosylase
VGHIADSVLRGGAKMAPAVFVPFWVELFRREKNRKFLQFPNNDSSRCLQFWSPKAVYRYNALLYSAHPCMTEKPLLNPRAEWDIPSNVLVIADSGGFQASTIGWKPDPLDVLRWQEKNADIAITLDIPSRFRKTPVPGAQGRFVWQGDDMDTFMAKCKESHRNNRIYATNRKNQNTRIYLVLQGSTEKRYSLWYKHMKEFVKEFDGFSIGGLRAGRPERIANTLAVVYHLGIRKNLHILGVAGEQSMPLLAWAGRYFDNITYDAVNYQMEAMKFRMYRIPGAFSEKLTFGTKRAEGTAKFSNDTHAVPVLPCSCPVCRRLEPDYWTTTSNPRSNTAMATHNLFAYDLYSRMMAGLRNTPDVFKNVLRKTGNKRAMLAIDYLDYAIKHSPGAADRLFGNVMSGEDSATLKPTSLLEMQDG